MLIEIKVISKVLIIIIVIIISIAYMTLLERKVLAPIGLRKGPEVVGIYGVLQPIADAIKLFTKETILPSHANIVLFIVAPIIGLTLGLISWVVIPLGPGIVLADINIGFLFLLGISSLGIGVTLSSGWSSNSKYPLLGSLRASAQFISYEVSIGLVTLVTIIEGGTYNLTEIVLAQRQIWYGIPNLGAWILCFIASLAETARIPFDLPEGESELVSGYNVEYSAMTFALFFLSEYSHIAIMSFFNSILFLGGWLPLSLPILTFKPKWITWIKSLSFSKTIIWFLALQLKLFNYPFSFIGSKILYLYSSSGIIAPLSTRNFNPSIDTNPEFKLFSLKNTHSNASSYFLCFTSMFTKICLILSRISFPDSLRLSLKVLCYLYLNFWARAVLPRYRYDQLMYLGWKSFLPLSLGLFIFTAGLVLGFDFSPSSFIYG